MTVENVGRASSLFPQTIGGEGERPGGAGKTGLSTPDMAAILGEMSKLAQGGAPSGATKGAARDAVAPPGAPSLEPPTLNLSSEDAILMLQSLQNKLTEGQLGTAKEGVRMDSEKKEALHQEAMKKLEEAAKKLQEAGGLGILNKVLNVFAKLAAFVASLAGVIAAIGMIACTAGAATPAAILLLGVSVVGMVSSAVDLGTTVANEISQASGGPDLTMSGLLSSAMTEIAKGMGASEEDAKKIGQWGAMAAQVTVAVTMAVVSLAAIPFTGGASATAGISSIVNVAKAISAYANIQGAVVSMASAGVSVGKGVMEYQATEAQADKLDIEKMIQKLQKQMEEGVDRIEDLMTQIQEATSRVASIVAGAGETRLQIARNMV